MESKPIYISVHNGKAEGENINTTPILYFYSNFWIYLHFMNWKYTFIAIHYFAFMDIFNCDVFIDFMMAFRIPL